VTDVATGAVRVGAETVDRVELATVPGGVPVAAVDATPPRPTNGSSAATLG